MDWPGVRGSWDSGDQCIAVTSDGTQCTRTALFHDSENPAGEQHYCKQHAELNLWWYSPEPSEAPEWAS